MRYMLALGKVLQRKSRLRKTIYTSKPQNQLTSAYITGLPNLLTTTDHFYRRKVIAGVMHFHQINHQLRATLFRQYQSKSI